MTNSVDLKWDKLSSFAIKLNWDTFERLMCFCLCLSGGGWSEPMTSMGNPPLCSGSASSRLHPHSWPKPPGLKGCRKGVLPPLWPQHASQSLGVSVNCPPSFMGPCSVSLRVCHLPLLLPGRWLWVPSVPPQRAEGFHPRGPHTQHAGGPIPPKGSSPWGILKDCWVWIPWEASCQ